MINTHQGVINEAFYSKSLFRWLYTVIHFYSW